MIRSLWVVIVASVLFACSQSFTFAQSAHEGFTHQPDQEFNEEAALAYSQAAMGRVLDDYTFTDSHGQAVTLSQFRGKPLVISMIFTSCHHTCPMLTTQLHRVVSIAREALDDDSFTVLTIGFDTAVDSPARMRLFAQDRGIATTEWWFLSTDATTIKALSKQLGFIYFPSAKGFDHLTQTTVVDAESRVYRQVYGQTFTPPQLVEPLKQLVFGTTAEATTFSGWIKGVRLLCTVYNPASGRYHFDYSLFIGGAVGLLSLGAVAIFLIRNWRHSKSPQTEA